jgi:hypothetical protein
LRIISKYHDYYDTAMGQGIDPSLVYKRDKETVEVSENEWSPNSAIHRLLDEYPWKATYWHHNPDLTLLLFCGKAYPFWYVFPDDGDVGKALCNLLGAEKLIHRAGSLYARRREFKKERGVTVTGDLFFPWLNRLEDFLETKDGYWGPSFRADNVDSYAKRVAGTPVGNDAHHHWRAPSLLLARAKQNHGPNHYAIVRNPVLKDLDFVKVMDPFTAFQEIAMFLGGVMAAEDQAPLRVGSDEVIARQKGFDEWSFRTQAPGQKKLNRQANRERKRGA